MKDKLTKRVKVDYKALIKGHGLWSVFKRFKKQHKNIKSDRRLMYCFCKSWLPVELSEVVKWQQDIQEMQRIAQTPWLED